MKSKKIFLFTAFLCCTLCLSTLMAQESINAMGGDATGTGGSASYSIGQLVYKTYSETTGSVAEGVQQPYEIYIISGIEDARDINLKLSAYPNPATDYLLLNINEADYNSFTYKLIDISGKVLQIEKTNNRQIKIDMTHYSPTVYFLSVLNENQQVVKSFKIIKK